MTGHIMTHASCGMGTRRLKITPKMRRHFPTCKCKTFEVKRWYDKSDIFHRKNCPWLRYQRKRKPRERMAWSTSWGYQ